MTPLVVITGPGGYLGRNLAACFRRAGWRVGGAGRHSQENLDWFGQLNLADGTMPEWPKCDLFIHAAYDFTAVTPTEIERRNVEQSIRILTAAKGAAKRTIFISSMAAHPEALSQYGLGKSAVEDFCRKNGIIIIRPGLLYGAPQGGLAASLAKAVKALPILPYPYYTQSVISTCHVADVCLMCLKLAELATSEFPDVPFIAAADRPWTFRALLGVIASAQGRSPLFIPIPWQAPWSMLRLAEAMGLKPSFRSDSLVSLSAIPSDLDRNPFNLEIGFRSLTPGSFNELSPDDPDWVLPVKQT